MLKTLLILEKYSPDMTLLEKREQWSKSWLKHFFDLIYPLHCQSTLAGINDIGGAPRTLQAPDGSNLQANLMVGSPPGNVQFLIPATNTASNWCSATPQKSDDIGIVVGTGAGAVTPTQDALQARIAHGEGAGQLLYGGCELYGLTFADPNGQFVIRRYFTNVLGGAITVQEVGIYSPAYSTTMRACYIFCIARDVVAPGITVNNGEILRVTYTPQITV